MTLLNSRWGEDAHRRRERERDHVRVEWGGLARGLRSCPIGLGLGSFGFLLTLLLLIFDCSSIGRIPSKHIRVQKEFIPSNSILCALIIIWSLQNITFKNLLKKTIEDRSYLN